MTNLDIAYIILGSVNFGLLLLILHKIIRG